MYLDQNQQLAVRKERTKPLRVLIGGTLVTLVIGGLLALIPEDEAVLKVKSGEWQLSCKFKDGWRDIPADKVVSRDDQTSSWQFTNGYAKNCEIHK